MQKEVIVLGGGCFWCTEAIFKMLTGIISVEPGYAGGYFLNPTYEKVCGGKTGHSEVIKLEYDSQIISLEDLLTVFFATHNPNQKDGQGNDMGEQYRSIILYNTENQKKIIEKFIKDLNNSSESGELIVTEVKKLELFYPAENYHKNYYENNKNQNYCQVVINPKLDKVKKEFMKLIK